MSTDLWIMVCAFDFFLGFVTGLMAWDIRMSKQIKELEHQLHILQFDKRLIKEKKQ